MSDRIEFTAADLNALMSAVFAELRRACSEPDRAEFALRMSVAVHNVPRVMVQAATGAVLTLPSGLSFETPGEFWETHLVRQFEAEDLVE